MNRDEKRDRLAAFAPKVVELESHRAMFPREPTGGTWISANDAGVCLALINWHRVEREPNNDMLSRGLVIRELAGKSTADEIAAALRKLPLRKLGPFRLIAIFPARTRVTEWQWNLERLIRRDHKWHRQHWFSSGFDEPRAERVRAKICASLVAGGADPGRKTMPAGVSAAGYSLSWLRELHRSHTPKRGPFSICMHRTDASTVSYTEVAVSDRRVAMRYKPGSACASTRTTATTLPVTFAAAGKLRL